ncbi:MAG: AAA family ATPase, partial [Acidobacteria bacterium]|nr:AAA family ATPase [Acidobacteriota bacterium]
MYIDKIKMTQFRSFRETKIDFIHPDQNFAKLQMPKPKLRNVNVLLGNNGSGKTTLLKAIAIAALGPAVEDANLPVYRLIRREPKEPKNRTIRGETAEAVIEARFATHEQDGHGKDALQSQAVITRRGDLERLRWSHPEENRWHPIFSSESEAFFFVGYGVTRRVESQERVDPGARQAASFLRAQRIRSLFEDAYSLMPLSFWLPRLKESNPGRFTQVRNLIDRFLGHTGYSFTGQLELGEYLFEKGALKIPFPALADGYRAYLGWIGDLLYHVCNTCPTGKKLVQNKGIVMVDEVDLHLHPKWQMTIVPLLAKTLPDIQFIVTSHSPLIVGSLEWMNIMLMAPGPQQTTKAKRLESAVHGLDADQVLLTDFFGL